MSVKVTKVDEQEFKSTIYQKYTDIIGEKLGGKVLAFSDEWFAAAENLIKPKEPIRDATRFTYAGAWYDGWETRRHNTEEADWVIFKMGVSSASLIGCEIDTAFFNGNHAPFISVEATNLIDESSNFDNVNWDTIIPKVECGPSQKQFFVRDSITTNTYTHIRLRMYPDGGIARFRLYGKVQPIVPNDLSIQLDTASAIQGGVCTSFSDQHFGSVDNLLLPGRGHDMSDGWETKRSRGGDHIDWVIIKLGHKTNIKKITVDTAHFRGNFPQYIKVEAIDSIDDPTFENSNWETIVDKSKTGADKEHDYKIELNKAFTHVKLIMIPDGGVKRLRCWGTLVN
jgi:allantoicase